MSNYRLKCSHYGCTLPADYTVWFYPNDLEKVQQRYDITLQSQMSLGEIVEILLSRYDFVEIYKEPTE